MRNVKLNRKFIEKKNRAFRPILAFFALAAAALSGCNASRESICGDLSVYSLDITGLQTQIAALDPKPDPKRLGKARRQIASVPLMSTPFSPDEIQEKRETWMDWAEKTLKRTQWAKDTLEDDRWGRKALPALNDAGLSLVSFHGYLEQAKWRKAVLELDRIETSLKRARKLACEVEVAPQHRKTPIN